MLNSTSVSDLKINVRANVTVGDLVVTPPNIDFGNTKKLPYIDSTVAIQNNSDAVITITGKSLIGDTSSYSLNNTAPIRLLPNQTDYVKVRFAPHTSGRKAATFSIKSSYKLAPEILIPLTGIGGDEPIIVADMQNIDFGMMRKGETKDTTITLRNDGSLDLTIPSKEIIGNDKSMFAFVNDGQPLVLRGGESKKIQLRATASLPIGGKTAQVSIVSNDPNSGTLLINLFASVRANVLTKSVDKIIFDTIDIGYHSDTTFLLKNDGDLKAAFSKFVLDGPYAQDFEILNMTVPFELAPGEAKVVKLRFSPSATGIRYAQILMTLDDPINPNQRVVLQGWGREVSINPAIVVDGAMVNNPEIDFGKVTILDTKTKEFGIMNLSKYGVLRVDTMYIDSIYKQPFSYGAVSFPIYINPGSVKTVALSFNPKDKVRSYSANVTIQYSDSTLKQDKKTVLKLSAKGSVLFPGMDVELSSVLEFGKVAKDQTLIKEFNITNHGETFLIIDSMAITGPDAAEFKIDEKFPVRIERDDQHKSKVIFKPVKIGSKEVMLKIYSSDLYDLGEIKLWAECIATSGQTTGITKTNEIPTTYNLQQNYPNPFNPSTKIEYSIPEASHVTVCIYNSLGQEVAKLVNESQSAGKYIIDWQAKNLPSGIYFYKMQSAKFSSFKKMILLK